ncbi:hypothetical protein F0562_029234 [Nyssa sinensis]|uniref:TRF2/HOY1 PH-like domain-containing protein n=1 Tax=Nyssa sinensis TaxID=561372 RepID=A0A5J5B3I5_9ASTE|nr:hypothetical protein F0562_029234 [Nyssa sinensis]
MVQRPGSHGIVCWNDKDGGFSTSGEFQNTLFESVNPKNNVTSGFQSSEAGTKRIKLSTEFGEQEIDVDSSEEASPLGLKLRKTQSFLNLVETRLSQATKTNCPNTANFDDFGSQPMSEKLKASNFPALVLKIGSWERNSKHEGDLIAKCYYAKRKLVWEVLEGALKSKIEIQWSDILAIRAITVDDEPGILEIELNQPPLFYRETNPQPRKHTLWQQASDFTGGQAPICRRHYVKFPPGTLDKHYEKLLQCDQRLHMISQKPFPSLDSPYFYSNVYGSTGFSFDFNGYTPEFPPPGLQYPFPSIFPPPFVPPHHLQNFKQTTIQPLSIRDSNSPMSVMDFPPLEENLNNYAFQNQSMAPWRVQGVNNIVNIQQLPSIVSVTQANAAFPCQNYGVLNYGEEPRIPNPNTGILDDIENHLLGDSQAVCSDERTLFARVQSMCSLFEHQNEAANHLEYNQQQYNQANVSDVQLNLTGDEHSRIDGMYLSAEPIRCLPPQVPKDMMMQHLPRDNSSYPYAFSDPSAENFAALDAVGEPHLWQ